MYNDDKANAEYDKQQRAYLNAVNEIQSFGKVISPSLIQALGGQSIADQMAKTSAADGTDDNRKLRRLRLKKK